MEDVSLNKYDEMVIQLLHYFITEKNYSPVILHGVQNEIWLENLDSEYRIVRIVSDYIHNDEQLEFDLFKTKQIMKKIKRKTFSFKVNTLSIFVNMNENVHLDNTYSNISCFAIHDINDLQKYPVLTEVFPTISTSKFTEKGVELFMKVTGEINKKTEEDAHMAEDIFKRKTPIVTYVIIALNVLLFLAMYLFGDGSTDPDTLLKFGASYGPLIRAGEYYRLLTSAFLHIGVLHLLFNCYALYIIGPQLESFFGKIKYVIIYIVSAIAGNLLSLLFTNSISAGASGAIFGLLGSLLYFGYHYRIYLGNVIRSQIIPLILVNLMIGFIASGINNAAHIGGLIGGVLITIALGVKYKSSNFEKINGWILTFIFLFFLIFMGFFPR